MITKSKQDRLAELENRKDPYNWDFILANLEVFEDEIGEKFLGRYLGDVINLNPSGKIYTFWTSNQTKRDVQLDEAYWARMQRFAERQGFGITFIDFGVFLFKMGWEPEDEEIEEDEGE